MYCPKCGTQLENGVCPNCGNYQNIGTPVRNSNSYDTPTGKKPCNDALVIILLIFFFPVGLYLMWARTTWSNNTKIIISSGIVLFFLLCLAIPNTPNSNNNVLTNTTPSNTVGTKETKNYSETSSIDESENVITIGDTFVFDDLEITFLDYSFTKVDNHFSDHDNDYVIEIPVVVKNIGDENNMLNSLYITLFGSAGTQLDPVDTLFDNDLFYAGQMRSGATIKSYIHMLYDGDGDYYINFSHFGWGKEVEVKVPVTKN